MEKVLERATHYYHMTKECGECGKRSKFKVYGRIMGGMLFNIIGYIHKGNVVDGRICPKCGTDHPVSQEGFKAWPMVAGGKNYYEVEEATS